MTIPVLLDLHFGKSLANRRRQEFFQRNLKRLRQEDKLAIRDESHAGFDSRDDVASNIPPEPLASRREFRLRQAPPKAELPYLRSNNVTGRSNVPSHSHQNNDF